MVVEVVLLAPHVVEQRRRRAVGADRLGGEVDAAEPAVVDVRAHTDRRRGVDMDVGNDVRAAWRCSRSCAMHEAPLHPRARAYLCERQKHVTDAHTRLLQDEERRASAESAAHAMVLPSERHAVALFWRVVQTV